MTNIHITRELRLQNIELLNLTEGIYGDLICYLLLLDFNRPSTLNDYPELKGIEDEDEFGRSNFIKCVCISSTSLDEETINEVVSIAGGFLENKSDCDWKVDFKVVGNESINGMIYDQDKLLNSIDNILMEYGFAKKTKEIPSYKFNLLSQD